jgi:hypothetical protein
MRTYFFRAIMVAALALASFFAVAAPAGLYNLGDRAITTALTSEVITSGVSAQGVAQSFIGRLEGATAATFQANFTWGSGGTTLKVDIETTFDQGTSWIPICRFAFTTASAEKVANVSGLTPKIAAYTPIALSDDVCVDGILGDRLRAKVTSTGTYAGNTSVSVRASIR